MLGEAASAGPVPVAEGGGWDIGDETVDEGSALAVSDEGRLREATASLFPLVAIVPALLGLRCWVGEQQIMQAPVQPQVKGPRRE